MIKVNTGSTDYYLGVPSIITSDITKTNLVNQTGSLVFNGKKCLASSYTGIVVNTNCSVFNPSNFLIYSGTITTDTDKTTFLNNLKNVYTGSVLNTTNDTNLTSRINGISSVNSLVAVLGKVGTSVYSIANTITSSNITMTLDSTTKGSNVTLSNDNLTYAGSSTWANGNVYATTTVNNGKFYAEFVCNTVNTQLMLGISTNNTYQSAGFYIIGYGYYSSNGYKYNNISTSYGATFTSGDVIGITYDTNTGNLTFYKNGINQGVAYTLTAGTAVYLSLATQYTGQSVTINFGSTPFTYPIPAGYTAWGAQ